MLMRWLSHSKITNNGYGIFLVALYGDLRAHTNAELLAQERDMFGHQTHFATRHKSTTETISRNLSYATPNTGSGRTTSLAPNLGDS